MTKPKIRGSHPLGYISGPYSAKTYEERDLNIKHAELVGLHCILRGFPVIIPHKNFAHFDIYEDLCSEVLQYDNWITMDLTILERCDFIVLLHGWKQSEGAQREFEKAKDLDLIIVREFGELGELSWPVNLEKLFRRGITIEDAIYKLGLETRDVLYRISHIREYRYLHLDDLTIVRDKPDKLT